MAGGCVSRPKGPDTPTMRRIESATHIIEYPSQRLIILKKIADEPELLPHEQIYLVDAILMGGFSSDRAEALILLIRNPCCLAETRDHIRAGLKKSRFLGRDERNVIDALTAAESPPPPTDEKGSGVFLDDGRAFPVFLNRRARFGGACGEGEPPGKPRLGRSLALPRRMFAHSHLEKDSRPVPKKTPDPFSASSRGSQHQRRPGREVNLDTLRPAVPRRRLDDVRLVGHHQPVAAEGKVVRV
jgi:hypothetical protein